MATFEFAPLTLEQDEQVVFAHAARILPTLSDVVLVLVFAPTLMLMPWLVVHFIFRRTVAVVTTRRVVVVEPKRLFGEIRLEDIAGFCGARKALLIQGKRRVYGCRDYLTPGGSRLS